jgi:hypothetical protein
MHTHALKEANFVSVPIFRSFHVDSKSLLFQLSGLVIARALITASYVPRWALEL